MEISLKIRIEARVKDGKELVGTNIKRRSESKRQRQIKGGINLWRKRKSCQIDNSACKCRPSG